MMNTRQKTKKAFTLVELSLAIAFLALLLIIMATLIMSLISIYRKGISINSVNTTGRSIIEDIKNSVSESGKFSTNDPKSICENVYLGQESEKNVCISDDARRIITQNFVYNRTSDGNSVPRAGTFCTGSYSYIWNSGDAIRDGRAVSVSYNNPAITLSNFRLLKIKDTGREVCKKQLHPSGYSGDLILNDTIDLSSITLAETPVDLIAESDNTLALYYLYIATPVVNNNSSNSFYSGTFVLATLEGGVNIMQAGNYCKPPGDYDSNFDYCAINKFNFATQAVGGI